MSFTDQTVLSHSQGTIATIVEGEAVIMEIASGSFSNLNALGSRIWWALETPTTVAALCETLLPDFDVPAETCLADVRAFVGALLDKGLITAAERSGR